MTPPPRLAGRDFASPALLAEALSHPAACRRDASGAPLHSERLEFLGDAVLALALAGALFEKFPSADEGELTRRRAALVSRASLARASRALGLPDLIDAGDEPGASVRIRATDSAAENAFEAVVGAVYLDAGWPAARDFALAALGPLDAVAPGGSARNRLQEKLQAESRGANVAAILEYRTVSVSGPDHARRHVVEVLVRGESWGTGEGASVKVAAEAAALAALSSRYPEPGAP